MGFNVISKSSLPEWIKSLIPNHQVYGPQKGQDGIVFESITSPDDVILDYATTILPPKKILMPQQDDIFDFQIAGNDTEPYVKTVLDDSPKIVLGIHTCDLHAIALLDRVFDHGFADQHYRVRRDNTIFVSIECLQPCSEHAFCKDMDTLFTPGEFDLHLTDLGEDYALGIGSDRGLTLIQDFSGVREAGSADYERLSRVMSQRLSRFPYRLDTDSADLPNLFSNSQKSYLWDELGERCLGCGSCTLVCPTCYCFDMVDEIDFSLNSGHRYRTWDTCQIERYAIVAGGHNFRAKQSERVRHRFAHKFKYIPDLHGLIGCVGCGRCAETCLVQINPVEVINKLAQSQKSFKKHHRKGVSV